MSSWRKINHRPPRPPDRQPAGRAAEGDIATLAEARIQVQSCRRCPLYVHATQAVFGEGAVHAEIMFVGEQPGDKEDLAGKPFVGPAGMVLDAALDKVGIARSRVYVTNAVKHFKFEPRQKAHSPTTRRRRDSCLQILAPP